jgi:hydrogenase maturation protease
VEERVHFTELRRPILAGILVIGYGNLLRGDDAVGCRVAQELAQLFHGDPEIDVIASPQLTPEIADDISRSGFVLFVDASDGEAAGTIRRRRVAPESLPGGFTHSLTPSALLSAAEQVLLTLAGWSFELGSQLSAGARRSLPKLVQQARDVIERHRTGAFGARTVAALGKQPVY